MGKRIEFIDYAKGVCIMFIVLFHEQVSRLPYAAKWGGVRHDRVCCYVLPYEWAFLQAC